MKKMNCFFLMMLFLLASGIYAQEIVGTGTLSIGIENTGQGVKVVSIKKHSTELLDTETFSTLFTMTVDNVFLTSLNGWDSVNVNNNGSRYSVILTNPTSTKLSKSLAVTVTINVDDVKSDWDISVTGLGNNTLNKVSFPYINIKATGNDNFLVPKYSGKIIKNPKRSSINYSLQYPRGWSATMQFCAYYNDNYGVYLGSHDNTAALKTIRVKKNIRNGLTYYNEIPIPNKSLPGNDWQMPGTFRLQVFEGDWFEAAQIYKKWVFSKADYGRYDDSRNRRQQAIGDIALWMYYGDYNNSDNLVEEKVLNFANDMGVPIGMHWYSWNNKPNNSGEPYYFPERPGMKSIISSLGNKGIRVMPYTCGQLYDKGNPNAATEGISWSTKNENKIPFLMGTQFYKVCPTQQPFQDIIVDANDQLVNRIGTKGIYVDMICASSPKECMDPAHNHTLGGGSFWRDGHVQMLKKIHSTVADSIFITAEGACDYLFDEVDGYLVDGWQTDNMVPAYQVVYGGKIQLFGIRGVYTYNTPSYYTKFTNAFVNGITPGRFNPNLFSDPNAQATARPFVKRLAKMRNKLKEFLAFGEMLKPLQIDRTNIDDITSTWTDYGKDIDVTVSALQSSFWKNREENKVAIIFANASMSETLNFNLDFDGNSHNIYGKLKVQKITSMSDNAIENEENSFSKSISIAPMEIVAYVIEPDSMLSDVQNRNIVNRYSLKQNYPNPFNPATQIDFSIPISGNTRLEVYNVLGQKVATLVNKELQAGSHSYRFNANNLPSGVYIYKLQSSSFSRVMKMMIIK